MVDHERGAWIPLLVSTVAALNGVFCATCNKDGFYCVTKDVFQECVDSNVTSPEPYVCPPGTYCHVDCAFPCSAQSCATCNPAGYDCPSEGYFQLCDGNGEPGPEVNPCPLGTVCSKNCNNPGICTERACPVTCTETTRLPVNGNGTNYYLCVVAGDGSVVVQEYSCPGSSLYDSATKRCTNSSSTPQPFRCVAAGRFADPNDCRKYYLCSRSSLTGILYYFSYDCPNYSYFSSRLSKCVSDPTVCRVRVYSTRMSVCKSDFGRFEDPESDSHYFMCSWSRGELVPYRYACPGTSVFNPATSKCTYTLSGT